MRATFGTSSDADSERTLVHARRATELETDPDNQGYVVARVALGGRVDGRRSLRGGGRDPRRRLERPARRKLPDFVMLQVAGLFAASLLRAGDDEGPSGVRRRSRRPPSVPQKKPAATAPRASLTLLRLTEGRLAYRAGEIELAARVLCGARRCSPRSGAARRTSSRRSRAWPKPNLPAATGRPREARSTKPRGRGRGPGRAGRCGATSTTAEAADRPRRRARGASVRSARRRSDRSGARRVPEPAGPLVAARDRVGALPLAQHRQGLHEEPLSEARRRDARTMPSTAAANSA